MSASAASLSVVNVCGHKSPVMSDITRQEPSTRTTQPVSAHWFRARSTFTDAVSHEPRNPRCWTEGMGATTAQGIFHRHTSGC